MIKGPAIADVRHPDDLVESERPLPGNSELARLMRAFDWRSTGIGAPETWPKSLRTAVGIMLTSFGLFWGAEGAGVSWPGHDASLLGLIPVVALVSLGYTLILRQWRTIPAPPVAHPSQEGVIS